MEKLGKTLSKYFFLFFNCKSMLLNMSVAQWGTVFIIPGVHIGSPTSLSSDRFYGCFFSLEWKKNRPKT